MGEKKNNYMVERLWLFFFNLNCRWHDWIPELIDRRIGKFLKLLRFYLWHFFIQFFLFYTLCCVASYPSLYFFWSKQVAVIGIIYWLYLSVRSSERKDLIVQETIEVICLLDICSFLFLFFICFFKPKSSEQTKLWIIFHCFHTKCIRWHFPRSVDSSVIYYPIATDLHTFFNTLLS